MSNTAGIGQVNRIAPRGTNQYPWRKAHKTVVTGTGGSLSADSAYLWQASLPDERFAGAAANPGRVLVTGFDPCDAMLWKFLVGNADNETFTAKLWGWRRLIDGVTTEFLFDCLLTGVTITAGATAGPTTSAILDGVEGLLWADTFVATDQTLDNSLLTFGEAADNAIVVFHDAAGYQGFMWELLAGTGTACQVLCCPI